LNGWLIAGWFLLLFVLVTIWFNWRWNKMQRRVASQRPSLDRQAYADELANAGVSEKLAFVLHDALQPMCAAGVMPHPDDGLMGFYFDDPEDMEDLVEDLFVRLNLPMLTRYEPEITPHLESARNLAIYLQKKLVG
jgi:hypothetical protein